MVERIRGKKQVLSFIQLQEYLRNEWGIPTEVVEWKRGSSVYRKDGYAIVRRGCSPIESVEQNNHFFIPTDCVYRTKDGLYQIDFDYLKKGVSMFRYDLTGYAFFNVFRDKLRDVTVRDNYKVEEEPTRHHPVHSMRY